MPYINRRTKGFQRLIDNINGTVNAGTESTGLASTICMVGFLGLVRYAYFNPTTCRIRRFRLDWAVKMGDFSKSKQYMGANCAFSVSRMGKARTFQRKLETKPSLRFLMVRRFQYNTDN